MNQNTMTRTNRVSGNYDPGRPVVGFANPLFPLFFLTPRAFSSRRRVGSPRGPPTVALSPDTLLAPEDPARGSCAQ